MPYWYNRQNKVMMNLAYGRCSFSPAKKATLQQNSNVWLWFGLVIKMMTVIIFIILTHLLERVAEIVSQKRGRLKPRTVEKIIFF